MILGSSAVSKLAIVIAGAVVGGAAVSATAALTTHHPTPRVHQRAAIRIEPAPDQYIPAAPRILGSPPATLGIPALGVHSTVEQLGVTQDYSLEAPQGVSDVGWYRLGAAPGSPGDAIISGHRGYPGGVPSVFTNLDRLHDGDEIDVVSADGQTTKFNVDRVFKTPYRNVPEGFFAIDGPPRLTLVTCTGDFDSNNLTYSDRLVVEAIPAA